MVTTGGHDRVARSLDEEPAPARVGRPVVVQVSVSAGGIPKRAVGSAFVGRLGLEGDGHHADTVHGGPIQAVCLFGMEAIERLRAEGHPVIPGGVGENLTTRGIDWSTLPVGTRVRVGDDLVLELTKPAMPCETQRPNFSDGRFNRISVMLHPSDSRMYAQVLREGTVRPADRIELLPVLEGSEALLVDRLDHVEDVIAYGFLALWRAARGAGHDVYILDDGDLAVSAAPGIESPLYNDAVTGLRTLPHLMGRVLDHYRAAGSAGLVEAPDEPWPGARPGTPRAVLASDIPGVATAAAPDGIDIRAVQAGEWRAVHTVLGGPDPASSASRLWADVLPGLLATRGVTAFVAERNGVPVATGTLVTHRKVASLVAGAVVPEARGLGIQRALIAARAQHARDAGCTLICAETEPDTTSERNLRRMGLERLRLARTWRFDPAGDPTPDLTELPSPHPT